MEKRILLVDDDEKMCSLLIRYLGEFGFAVTAVTRPSEAIAALDRNQFDLAILNVMLPEMDGFELFKKIRESEELPIIMLTARGELPDKVLGLELGSVTTTYPSHSSQGSLSPVSGRSCGGTRAVK